MTTDPLYAAALRDICEHPAEDAPRLMLADWLEEQGETERAEFIRVQIELAARHTDHVTWPELAAKVWHDLLPEEPCRACWLEHRERELLKANIGTWTEDLPDELTTKPCPHCEDGVADYETNVIECGQCESTGTVFNDDAIEFRRGFVSEIRCTASDFLQHADAILEATLLETVHITRHDQNSEIELRRRFLKHLEEGGKHSFNGANPDQGYFEALWPVLTFHLPEIIVQ